MDMPDDHAVNSPILQDYVLQAKETAWNARRKMGNYLDNENQDLADDTQEVRQVRHTEEQDIVKPSTLLEKVAGVTGLEPAASGVTGQRSNQLSYTPAFALKHDKM